MSTYQLLETVKSCSQPSEMEMSGTNSQVFQSIESIVRSFDELIKPLSKLQFQGGNEPYLTEIAKRLKNYMRANNFLTDNWQPNPKHNQQLKRITCLLMLNCDVVFKYDLNKDIRVCHLLNLMPQMPPCVLVYVIWALNLDQHFFAALAYCPIWFSMQFLDEAIDSLRHCEPDDANRRMNGMLKAIYLNIVRTDYYPAQGDKVEKKITLNKILTHITNLLRRYNTPDVEKFEKWSTKKQRRQAGHVLYYLMDVVRHCLHWFQHKPPMVFDEVFDLQIEDEKRVDNRSQAYSAVVLESLLEINTCLLNTLQNVVMTVTLDTFMYWVELNLDEQDPENRLPPLFGNDGLTEYTLQYAIGVSAYYLKETINTNQVFAHNVQEQLNTICVKPQSLEDRLHQAKMSDLITKLDEINSDDSDEVRKKWFNEFLSRGEIVFGNEECMETVEYCIKLFDGDNIKIMTRHLESEALDSSDKVTMEKLLLQAIDVLSVEEAVAVAVDLVSQFGPNFSFTEIDNVDGLLVEYLNKTTTGTVDVKGYLKILYQAPRLVHERIFRQLPTVTREQMNCLVRLLAATQAIAVRFVEPLVNDLQSIEMSMTGLDIYVAFVGELLAQGLLDKPKFLQKMLKQDLVKAMTTHNHNVLWLNLQILEQALSDPANWNSLGAIPPLIVTLATCMERSRWDILTYDEIREKCLISAINLTAVVVQKFTPLADQADKAWITAKLQSFSTLTKFYFQNFSSTDKSRSYDQYVLTDEFPQFDGHQQKTKFCEVFVRSTPEEVKLLAKNSDLWDLFTDCTLIIAETIGKSTETNSFAPLKYILSNYLQFVRTLILPTMPSTGLTDSLKLLEKIVAIVQHIPAVVYEVYVMDLCFLPMSEFLKHLLKLAKTVDDCDSIAGYLAKLEACEASENLLTIVKMEREMRVAQ